VRPLYTVWGDEALLAQEAGDTIRAAARASGCAERQVHVVAGNHFDWSGLLGATKSLSLFSERQLIEIRIPSGKPGKEGSDALQRYCASLNDDSVTLLQLPDIDWAGQKSEWFNALDGAGVVIRVYPVERKTLPQWITQRLASQGHRLESGEEGQHALAFFSDQVEGNLLAAHQEVQKLALLYPPGELTLAQIESAVSNVARYDGAKLGAALLAGQVTRALRMLEGLQAEGEAAVRVHWHLASDIRTLKRLQDFTSAGKPLPLALRDAGVRRDKEQLFARALPLLPEHATGALLAAAQLCDGVIKGLPDPGWPLDPWEALKKLALLLLQHTAIEASSGRPRDVVRRLALQP
jgi:DNA polymerase-3 subunit delta